jgi:hypothetical protein
MEKLSKKLRREMEPYPATIDAGCRHSRADDYFAARL